ncbi:MAG: diguanylate cyclase [Marinobacter sp.]|uniref:diguanylate cyclase n=1 Tax=Marinobacter sp. TaxID=50741 RepID=UPI00299D46F6|nr:diguanylate cyclase [Marinobacter sp.]MDX1633192.1 diguanylate cyclase [Marinobacter sp.]
MASEQSWKQQYLQELDSSKAREQQWQSERHTLERLLVRTSFAAEGQDDQLDRLLEGVREHLRRKGADPGGLRRLQEQLDQRLVALESDSSGIGSRLRDSLQQLISALRHHELFQGHGDQLKQLGRQLSEPDTLQRALPEWLLRLAELEVQALQGGSAAKSGNGLLGRLFGGRPAPSPEPPVTMEVPASALDATDPCEPFQAALKASHAQRARFARRVAEVLEHMLSQVTLAPAAHARALSIRSRLAESDDWQELRDALNETAELIIAAVSRGQLEFESFLKRLDERLLALQTHLLEQSAQSEHRQSASEQLETSLNRDLQALTDNLEQSDDMAQLKASVSKHLESIAHSVRHYREQESAREALAQEQLAVLQEKLATLEAHSEHTKEQLRQERSRALTDVLTQLPNREAWQERLAFEYERWQRYHNPVTLCVLDIDHFKAVNDSYGHKAGDRVIQLMAKVLRDRLRATDFVARYGGEEFVVLLPETGVDTALEVINKLRSHIRELPFHFQGEPVSITFSAGLAPFREGVALDAVFDQADRALYQAKAAGRNQVLVAPAQ